MSTKVEQYMTFEEFRSLYPNKVPDGVIDKYRELDGYPLTEERLNEIEAYEFYNIQQSSLGEKVNPRFVLSMIRELRALRVAIAECKLAFSNLESLELKLRNPHER